MYNPTDLALTEVVNNIPPQILEVALRTYNRRHNESCTLTTFIMKAIVKDRVLKLCNLSAGEIKTIALRPAWVENVPSEHEAYAGDDGPYTLYRIPPEYRDNLPMTGVLSVQYPFNTYLGGGLGNLQVGTGGYTLVDQIDQILNSYTLATPRNHPVARLLSGDLVKITPSQYAMQTWLLTVRLAYNDQFTNLHESSAKTLAKLIVLATKQWCYTNLIVDIDRAVQETGADIGVIKQIVEEYRDAGQQFEEQLIQWQGCALLTPEARRRLLIYQL